MLPIRWLRPAFFATAALLISAYPLLAQGKGRPSFPPGLHDRTLPPGKPFDGGGFDPPGRRGAQPQSAAQMAGLLDRLLADPAFPDRELLVQAVDAFNLWVMAKGLEELASPSPSFLAAHSRLSNALGGVTREARGESHERQDGGLAEFRDQAVDAFNLRGLAVAIEELASPSPSFFAARGRPGDAPGVSPMARGERYEERDRGLDELQWQYFLPGGTVPLPRTVTWTIPGMTAANPSGFGAEFGTVWAGVSYQPRARYSTGQTGAAAVGFGLGDASRWVGLQVGINSFSTISSGFGKRMAVDLHLHRSFGGMWGLAVGWESPGAPESVTRDSGENHYVVGSRWLQFRDNPDAPFGLGMLSLGAGTGRYQSEADFHADAGGIGLFGSFGIRLAAPVSLVAEWTGQDLLLATSVTPLRNHGLAITAGFTEITGAAGDGARFTLGGSMGHRFR